MTPAREITSRSSSLSGERLQVTALFYDIVGSVQLLNRLDPEEFGGMQRRLHHAAADAIQHFGGTVQQLQGDGGCAYFGLPVPLEDAAEAAVGAALDLIARCERQQREQGTPLMIRIGIATSMVVVAATKGTGLPGQAEIIGIAPALAARIQADAAPNSVVVADSTYRLAAGAFDFEPLGERLPSGFSEPISLWRARARRPTPDRFTASRRVGAPLIGREEELEACRRHWALARAGKGQLLVLHGEAGIGKSRLVAELRAELGEAGHAVTLLQCRPRGDTRPLHPFLDLLEPGLGSTADGALSAAQVRAGLHDRNLEISVDDAAIIAFLCGQQAGHQPPAPQPRVTQSSGPHGLDLTAEEIRARGQDAVLRLLCGQPGPCLVVIEDFHWADSLTGAVVARLPRVIADLPVLVLVTARDRATCDALAGPNVSSLALSRLEAEETSQLLETIWNAARPAGELPAGSPPAEPLPASLPPGLAAFVHGRCDGVPLFAEQLTSLLKETMEKQLAEGRSLPTDWNDALPGGTVLKLQDLIAARLSALGPLRRLAQVAAVIGRAFTLGLLTRILDGPALPVLPEEAVRELVRAGIFEAQPSGVTEACRFRHVLIQEAAYDSLLKAERRLLHARIIDLVSTGAVPPLADDALAWHYEQADRPLDAARCAINAAMACIARSAMLEADRLLNVAQRQLADMAAERTRDLRLELLSARGPVAAALFGRGSPQASAVYDEGVALCSASATRDRAQWFPLYWGWWFTAPNYEAQKARSDIVVRDLEATADPEVRLQSFHCAWATNFDAGRHAYCLDCVEAGLALYDEPRARLSRVRYGGHDARVCGLGERALSSWFTGDEAGSARAMAAALDWAERIDHPDSLFHALDYAVGLARFTNDFPRVIKVAARMSAIAQERALPGGRAKAKLFGGWAQARLGALDAGVSEFNEGFALQREIGTEENLPIYRDMEAELLAQSGRYDQACAIVEEAIASSSRSGQVFWLPELYRRRARLRRHLGAGADETLLDLHRAVALAESQGAVALVRRAHADIDAFGGPPGPVTGPSP
ncbi:putative ATPase/class 3 adenylate cyclase [Angulomicrobium tetraedrale]|uniref:Putative ATPase/class 3 adenylate cyclase n=1 Tax=Ancylobacter tetraedralis TaxID=217068 RepID=A0A839ZB93_9HYPH|nr:AAA family ATPase [Ancylobacter tetraedralis]MBB3771972.1 putative ATPase/class 3 adenylate cyclase [Ancylobacter tetraedralis]